MFNEPNPCETHHDVRTPGGFCPVCLHQRAVDAERKAARLEAALERLIDAADPHMAAQDHAPDPRCGLTQPISVEEGEELNDAVANARETIARIHALHSSDAPASEPGRCPECHGTGERCLGGESAHPDNWYACELCGGSGKVNPAPAARPECSCNPGWSENCPVHGDGELEDVVESDCPEPRQMDQASADRLGERIRKAKDSALSPSPEDRPQTDAQREALDSVNQIANELRRKKGVSGEWIDHHAGVAIRFLSQSGQAVPEKWVNHPDSIPPRVIEECRQAIRVEFGGNGTDGYYKRILARVFHALATHPADGDSPAVPGEYVLVPKERIDLVCRLLEGSAEPFDLACTKLREIAAAPDPTGGEK